MSVPLDASSSAGSCSPDIGEPNSATADFKNAFTIKELIKPIGYVETLFNDNKDVIVTFLPKRFDGKETLVTNKFLKINNPLLMDPMVMRKIRGIVDVSEFLVKVKY
ncbi:Chromo domain protein LHP1 [Capsicum baccatum]|uniref:Chromo domain protein LHP1 n=1 Tax=Capsicum baccatum TaxID=33114 RepID=A0A2G2XQM4_CAPBA|nr:Chromo domain protein LHP1 [Capsicum baccatum]